MRYLPIASTAARTSALSWSKGRVAGFQNSVLTPNLLKTNVWCLTADGWSSFHAARPGLGSRKIGIETSDAKSVAF